MQNKTIAFIGAGHMGSAIISGLIAAGYTPNQIWASCPTQANLDNLQKRFGIHVTQDNCECAAKADILILAVKPQILINVVIELYPIITKHNPLIISIAAGMKENLLRKTLSKDLAIVSAMPNRPALLGCSATAMFANRFTSAEQKQQAGMIFSAIGTIHWLDEEKLLHAVTAVSGNGPAYFFLLMDALQKSAVQLGLPEDMARKLITQTALGSARMVLENDTELSVMCQQVASPGGTTEQSLKVLRAGELHNLVHSALTAGEKRAIELSERNSKLRLFFAITCNGTLQQSIQDLSKPLRKQPGAEEINWTRPEKLHITLRFLGDTELDKILPCLAAVTENIKNLPAFNLEIGTLTKFPPQHPHAIALNVHLSNELAQLFHAIDSAVAKVGFVGENRPFLPHITLGRARIGEERLTNLIKNYSTKSFPPHHVDHVILFRSDQTATGTIYTEIKRLALDNNKG